MSQAGAIRGHERRRRPRSAVRCARLRSSGSTPRSGCGRAGSGRPPRRSGSSRVASAPFRRPSSRRPSASARSRATTGSARVPAARSSGGICRPAAARRTDVRPSISRKTRRSQSSREGFRVGPRFSTGPNPSSPPRSCTPSTTEDLTAISPVETLFANRTLTPTPSCYLVPSANPTAYGGRYARARSFVRRRLASPRLPRSRPRPCAPPRHSHERPTAAHEVRWPQPRPRLTIPLAFIRNQFSTAASSARMRCRRAITVPDRQRCRPPAFLARSRRPARLFKAFGAAAASVTGPANAAVTPLINNDVFLVVPKAFHALTSPWSGLSTSVARS